MPHLWFAMTKELKYTDRGLKPRMPLLRLPFAMTNRAVIARESFDFAQDKFHDEAIS